MTTNYPGGTTPTGPSGPDYVPPARDDDAAWGCAWWWWFLIIIIIILIIWWGGWGWGNSGGYWRHRNAPVNGTGNGTVAPMAPRNRTNTGANTGGTDTGGANRSGANENGTAPGGSGTGSSEPASRPGMILPSGLMIRM